jgi:hypothetical protein
MKVEVPLELLLQTVEHLIEYVEFLEGNTKPPLLPWHVRDVRNVRSELQKLIPPLAP